MSKLGTFNDQSVSLFKEHFEQPTAFSEATEVYDFARCQRPDGSVYGTSGQCRKGTDAGDKTSAEKKSKAVKSAKSPKAPTTREEAQAVRRAAVVNALKKEGLPTHPPGYKRALNKALKAHPEYSSIASKTKELQKDADEKGRILKEVRKRQEKNPHDLAIRKEAREKEQAWQQAQREATKGWGAMRAIEKQEQRKLDDRMRSVTAKAISEARKREPIVGNDMGSPKRLGDADILTSPYD